MIDTPTPREPSPPRPAQPTPPQEDLLDELLWLARDAQERLPQEILGDRGYVLGQRNTYARAAGIVTARESHEDPALIADRIVHALADGATDLTAIRDAALAGIPRPASTPALEWLGPKAFHARYGDVPGVDHDYGTQLGPAGNQRITFRRVPGAADGMLYAHDATWDEYALIRRSVATRVVSDVFLQASLRDEHLPPEDFVHLLEARLTSPGRDTEPITLAAEL